MCTSSGVFIFSDSCGLISSYSSLNSSIGNESSNIDTENAFRTKDLPLSLGKIKAAVYGFGDYSGQRKQAPSSTFSTAVTQGAENYLIKSLLSSQWFLLYERTKLNNLTTERKILQHSLGERSAPNLQVASVLFEGGIVSYDFNVKTGGSGARLLGIGASTKYREDLIGVSLRVVRITDGAILHNVNCTANAFSKSRDFGVFSYVDEDKILELETGRVFNLPIQTALSEAIDRCVVDIVLEGIKYGSWRLKGIEQLIPLVNSGKLSKTEIEQIRLGFAKAPKISKPQPSQRKVPSAKQPKNVISLEPQSNQPSRPPVSEPKSKQRYFH